MRNYITLLLLAVLYASISTAQNCEYNRYNEQIFNDVTIHTNIVYGVAPELDPPSGLPAQYHEDQTHDLDLLMDIYEPTGDTLTKRPMIIFIHGGAFLPGGTFHNDDMLAFCDTFAHRGYVTASMEYRLGYNAYDGDAAARAVYRAIQDGRAAIRFLKENADNYGIDTNNIFMLGSSAGAFIALQNLYMNEESERPSSTYTAPDLGCLDCEGNTLVYNSHPKAIVSLWGALQDSVLINLNDIKPTLLVHGTDDDIVPFGVGAPFNSATLPETYGSQPIAQRLANLGYVNPDNYFVTGEGHEFYGVSNGDFDDDGVAGPNEYWDTIVYLSSNFIYLQHKPDAYFSYVTNFLHVDFTDLSLNAIEWCWDFGDGATSTEQSPSHSYTIPGMYTVNLRTYNDIYSYGEHEFFVYVDTDSTVFTSTIDIIDYKIYPNPTSNYIVVESSNNYKIDIIDLTGKEILHSFTNSNKVSLDLSDLNKGVYFIRLSFENTIKTEKLIIK